MSDEPERTFSDTGLMIIDRRNRLSEHTINMVGSRLTQELDEEGSYSVNNRACESGL